MGNNGEIVGIIHQYGKDDFSIWNVQLSEDDANTISKILEKYDTTGYSVRGNSQIQIKEVF